MTHLRVRALVLTVSLLCGHQALAQHRPVATAAIAGSVRRDGARLHFLEWRGAGGTIVLLPGYSLTAHVYESIGRTLGATNRVVALTPRGFGESDAPDDAKYTIATLVDDLHALMDTLGIQRATLVGHSLSGTVAATFALAYPARVTRLILLDSYPYFAAAGGNTIAAKDPVAPPEFTGDTTSERVAAYLGRYRFVPWNADLAADMRAKPRGAESVRRRALTNGYIDDQWKSAPDLSRLAVPSLQVCSMPSVRSEYPWLTRRDRDYTKAAAYIARYARPFARAMCQRYAATVPNGRSIQREGSHYLFFTQPAVTVAAIQSALSGR